MLPSPDPEFAELHAQLATVAVTGTNGKTTTTAMLAAIARAAGEVDAAVTTLGGTVGGAVVAEGTSLEAFRATVRAAVDAGARTLAVEMTSQALEAGFARRWPPRVAVFTNLTRDHLDHHRTPERYLAAKAQLFLALAPGGTAVLNRGDPASALLAGILPSGLERRGYGVREAPDGAALPATLGARRVQVDRGGIRIALAPSPLAERLRGSLRLEVLGAVHAENALAAAVAADALGYPAGAIRAGLSAFRGVPGRFEVVHREPLVVVDYAHTPDGLERTLSTARALADGAETGSPGEEARFAARPWTGTAVEPGGQRRRASLLLVFGCGGERDQGKRPEMGAVAARLADAVWLTTDNPRGEDPATIAAQVEAGRDPAGARWTAEPDRASAIRSAIAAATPHDVVVVAGKGHERTQELAQGAVPFSDVEVCRQACEGPPAPAPSDVGAAPGERP